MKQVLINLYSFKELDEKAKQKAIDEHANFMASLPENEELMFNDSEVVENIELNEYLFFEDGELANVTEYTGNHEKSGKIELTFHGRVYDITQ